MSHLAFRASVATVVVFILALWFFAYTPAFAAQSNVSNPAYLSSDGQFSYSYEQGQVLGESTDADDYGTGETTNTIYCPALTSTLQKGSRDATTRGQVSELQVFLTDYFDLNENVVVGGLFGKLTQQYLIKFQKAEGLPAQGIAGSMTRAKIAQVCGGKKQDTASKVERRGYTDIPRAPESVKFSPLTLALGQPVSFTLSGQQMAIGEAPMYNGIVITLDSGQTQSAICVSFMVVIQTQYYNYKDKKCFSSGVAQTVQLHDRNGKAADISVTATYLSASSASFVLKLIGTQTIQTNGSEYEQSVLQEKRQQLERARSAVEPSLITALVKIIRKIQAYSGNDIPASRAFAERVASRVANMESVANSLSGKNVNDMSLSEVEAALAKYTQLQSDKQLLLSGYNNIPIAELERLEGRSTTTTLGSYRGYINGSQFIATENITQVDAIANCKLNAQQNPTSSIRCTWNNTEIYNKAATTGTSLKSVSVVGVYEGTYPSGVMHSAGNHPQGTVTINITGPANTPQTLVLSSYEPVEWIINNPTGVKIEKIVTLGYHDQAVSGYDEGTQFEFHTYAKDGGYGWSCAFANYETGGGCSYAELKQWLSQHGMSIGSFTGAYAGKVFTVSFGSQAASAPNAQVASVLTAIEVSLQKILSLLNQ